MPRISKKGGAAMLGGVRSPMAASGHGLVGRSKLKPRIGGMSRKSTTNATVVSSPQKSGDNV
jgi:hypothetical protein